MHANIGGTACIVAFQAHDWLKMAVQTMDFLLEIILASNSTYYAVVGNSYSDIQSIKANESMPTEY